MLVFRGVNSRGFSPKFLATNLGQLNCFVQSWGAVWKVFHKWDGGPNLGYFFAFPGAQNLGSYFIMFTFTMYMMYVYIYIEIPMDCGGLHGFFSHDSFNRQFAICGQWPPGWHQFFLGHRIPTLTHLRLPSLLGRCAFQSNINYPPWN